MSHLRQIDHEVISILISDKTLTNDMRQPPQELSPRCRRVVVVIVVVVVLAVAFVVVDAVAVIGVVVSAFASPINRRRAKKSVI